MFKTIIMGQLRHALTVVAGVLVTNGYLEASYQEAFVGIALGIVGAVWSGYDKINKKSK